MVKDFVERIAWNVAQIVGRIVLDENQGALFIAAYVLAAVALLTLACVAVFLRERETPEVIEDSANPVLDAAYVAEFMSEKASEFITIANQLSRGDIVVYRKDGTVADCSPLVRESRELAAWLTMVGNRFKKIQKNAPEQID